MKLIKPLKWMEESVKQPAADRIYLDNAATTRMDPEVLEKMLPYLTSSYGNPSSLHYHGREARIAIEESRKTIAALLGVKPQTIIFTSGGTESNNLAIHSAIMDHQCDHIITSPVEHHAILHTVHHHADENGMGVSFVKLDETGAIDLSDLRRLLQIRTSLGKKCLVTLMHANNETGNITDTRSVSVICKKYGALFHSDCVQTIGHYSLNLLADGQDMASASAHKFHGPKGIGFLYVKNYGELSPLLHGGGHEKGKRAGTENVASIVGMAQALKQSYDNFSHNHEHISDLRSHFVESIKKHFPGAVINGGKPSLYSTVSVSFPKNERTDNLILQLDQQQICASGGSACNAGAGSHVMQALGRDGGFETIRFSFSSYNTMHEVDLVIAALIQILN